MTIISVYFKPCIRQKVTGDILSSDFWQFLRSGVLGHLDASQSLKCYKGINEIHSQTTKAQGAGKFWTIFDPAFQLSGKSALISDHRLESEGILGHSLCHHILIKIEK